MDKKNQTVYKKTLEEAEKYLAAMKYDLKQETPNASSLLMFKRISEVEYLENYVRSLSNNHNYDQYDSEISMIENTINLFRKKESLKQEIKRVKELHNIVQQDIEIIKKNATLRSAKSDNSGNDSPTPNRT